MVLVGARGAQTAENRTGIQYEATRGETREKSQSPQRSTQEPTDRGGPREDQEPRVRGTCDRPEVEVGGTAGTGLNAMERMRTRERQGGERDLFSSCRERRILSGPPQDP